MGPGEFGFLIATEGADDGRSQRLSPLAGYETYPPAAAWNRMVSPSLTL